MGRRRRKIVKLPKKKLPKIFLCPNCNNESISIKLIRDNGIAEVKCGKCGITKEISISQSDQQVDAYCKFTDNFYT